MAALASYLDARQRQGKWLLRREDLDPPREVSGAADQILKTLECFGLHWDQQPVYQSQRHALYQERIEQLLAQQQAYHCECSRQQISARDNARGNSYDGFCRNRQSQLHGPTAIRLKTTTANVDFSDRIQGPQQQQLNHYCGDFVIRRKDRLYAYQIAVVCDDAEQGINQVVRGSDLLDSTPRQLYLQQLLGYPQPCYAHIPIMVNDQGQKLSKQTYATALDSRRPEDSTYRALQVLGQQPPAELQGCAVAELLNWAVEHWSLSKIPRQLTVKPLEV